MGSPLQSENGHVSSPMASQKHTIWKIVSVKTSIITFSVLIFWMFTGIFSSDDKGSNSVIEIEGNNAINNSTLVSARIFNAKPKISYVVN